MSMIKKISFKQILEVWKKHMPNMSLEPTSAMNCMKVLEWDIETELYVQIDTYDLQNMDFTPTFWGAFDDDKLVGVNSGHMTVDRMYRSRGLFVFPEYRKKRLGQKLLLKTISQGYHEKAIGVWSYPSLDAWMTYHHAGYYLRGRTFSFDWELDDNGRSNAKAIRIFDTEAVNAIPTHLTQTLKK
jgi:GNAT superfamily N-acetyltransferase